MVRLKFVLLALTAMTGMSASAENLLDASPDSIRNSAHVVRAGMDRSDPDQMYGYVTATKLLIQHGLHLAEQQSESALDYKTALLPATYNLAADTWTGWEDAHATAEQYRLIGLESARLNLSLRQDLDQEPARLGRGYWILGVHLLADGQLSDAVSAFESCRDTARTNSDEVGELMASGWMHVTRVVAGEDELDELAVVKQRLAKMGKDAVFYAAQFDHALAKFTQ